MASLEYTCGVLDAYIDTYPSFQSMHIHLLRGSRQSKQIFIKPYCKWASIDGPPIVGLRHFVCVCVYIYIRMYVCMYVMYVCLFIYNHTTCAQLHVHKASGHEDSSVDSNIHAYTHSDVQLHASTCAAFSLLLFHETIQYKPLETLDPLKGSLQA